MSNLRGRYLMQGLLEQLELLLSEQTSFEAVCFVLH
jgi:hypothetical protein